MQKEIIGRAVYNISRRDEILNSLLPGLSFALASACLWSAAKLTPYREVNGRFFKCHKLVDKDSRTILPKQICALESAFVR